MTWRKPLDQILLGCASWRSRVQSVRVLQGAGHAELFAASQG